MQQIEQEYANQVNEEEHEHQGEYFNQLMGHESYTPFFTTPCEFDFSQIIMRQNLYDSEPYYNKLVDRIIQRDLQKASLTLLSNINSQLRTLENELTQMVENERIGISTFSQNCFTNVGQYNHNTGQLIDLKTIQIEAQSKKYSQAEIIDNLPMQVRRRPNKIRKKKECVIKKSEQQVHQQFDILLRMFNLDIASNQKSGLSETLEALKFSDNSYNQLWDKIINQMDLKSEQNLRKTRKVDTNMKDSQINDVIGRIMKQATQYQQLDEQEEFDEQTEQEVIQLANQSGENEEKVSKQQPQLKKDFDRIKIERKAELSRNPKYQFAMEDQSDLSNFYDVLPKDQFAFQYPFELDQFQKRSILHLQRKQSVFVAAHTSAGKTVVAEYGIALAIKHKRKVIYTSPIKALSNQKYRQLSKKFDSVGIVTGDVSLNQSASCVIMTTQILRNNLYKGAEMIRDIQWVIFDQIHYINNAERGVVWQQTIIMLPQHVGLIMLSATVPNYMDFANWVGRTKRRVIFVMKTFHRPVPLEHSLFIFNKFHIIKEANGRFLSEQYNHLKGQIFNASVSHLDKKEQLKQAKQQKIEERGFYNDSRRQQKLRLLNKGAVDKFIKKIQKSDMETSEGKQEFRLLESLITDCDKKNLLPCVIFTFSKKKINSIVQKIYSNVLTDRKQQFKIMTTISKALSNLKPEDRQIEQFTFLTEICRAGYAIHHGDLLPLAKQIVQILFSEGLIKVLFATETFAMGINMPTKTVIFNDIKKVTGSDGQHRFLNSSQYVQMSGRAGRRGLDQKGTVIIIVKDPKNLPMTDQMIKMIDHPGQELRSKFKVTYEVILNLYTSKDITVKDMMQQSFFENPKFSQLGSNISRVKQLKSRYEQLSEIECPYNKLGTRNLIEQYMNNAKQIRDANQQIFMAYDQKKLNLPKFGLLLGHNNQTQLCIILKINSDFKTQGISRYLQVLIINEMDMDIYITTAQMEENQKKKGMKKKIVLEYEKKQSVVDKKETGQVPNTKNQYHYYVHYVQPSQILQIYTNKIANANSKQTEFTKQNYEEFSTILLQCNQKFTPFGLPQIQQSAMRIGLLDQYTGLPCHNCEIKQIHRRQHQQRFSVKKQMLRAASQIDTNELGMMGHFEGMVKLLKHFNFIHEDTLTLKGRVARQIDIYVTQVIVGGVLQQLDSFQVAALLSAFVCDYKPRPTRAQRQKQNYFPSPFSKNDRYTYNLQRAIDRTYDIIKQMTNEQLTSECYYNASSQEEMIMSTLNFHLVDTVYKWASGLDFKEAIIDTRAPEGTVVKTIMRLNMLLGNIKNVCRILGSSDLEAKVDEAVESIRRDIVFCQSLYLTG